MNVSTPTLITFVVYIAAMILIGFIAYRATKNFSDYILGGRSLGSFVTALSAGASDMSGWLLMGLPGAIFVAGLSESWIAIGLIVGAWLNRSEEHTSELQSLMRISYAVFCLQKKNKQNTHRQ